MAANTTNLYALLELILCATALCSVSWNNTAFRQLQTEWEKCGFPPKDMYGVNNTDYLKACKQNELMHEVHELCNLFLNFTLHECQAHPKKDLEKLSDVSEEFLNSRHGFYLCDDNLGVRIPDGISTLCDGDMCAQVCSELRAEHLCRLIVIFALTDYDNLAKVVQQLKLGNAKRTTSTTSSTASTNSSTTSKALPSTIPDNTTRASASTPQPTKATSESSPGNVSTSTPHPPVTTSQRVVIPPALSHGKTGSVTISYGQLIAYGVLFLLIGAGICMICYFRHTILNCLRENPKSSAALEDGKGSYRKIPTFEKIVPNLDDTVKAKSFIY